MKKILIIIVALISSAIINTHANAECTANQIVYTSCKPGYYLSDGVCAECPGGGTSDDKNDNGITACYLQAGANGQDDSGQYTYTDICPYVN